MPVFSRSRLARRRRALLGVGIAAALLAEAVPAWRTLSPGESGPDVAELQKALAALGYGEVGDTLGYRNSSPSNVPAARHLSM